MRQFINFIQKRCGIFYWLCWIYIFSIMYLDMGFLMQAILLFPINIVAWPSVIAILKDKDSKSRVVRRFCVGLLFAAVVLPFLQLYSFFTMQH